MDRMTGGSPRVEVYRGPARLLHWLTVLLVAVQIPVGLYHYVVRKDNVLGRMIPSLLRR